MKASWFTAGRLPSRPIDAASAPRRRRAIGVFELLLVAVALALVAFSPTLASIAEPDAAATTYVAPGSGPVERPETSFPGSAFYYLDPADIAANEARLGSAQLVPAIVEPAPAGPAAAPFRFQGSGIDYARALKCLTDAIYYEGATEPDAGQAAIAQVILNRVRHPSYPNSVCGVVYQGSERASGCQFSYSCDGAMARLPAAAWYARARTAAVRALGGAVFAPVGLATHYHTTAVHPGWADSLTYVGTIGAHRFYRWSGLAGTPGAFFARYAGGEPLPFPHARTLAPPPITDPVQLARDFEADYRAGLLKAQAEAARAAAAPARLQAAVAYAPPAYSAAAQAQGGEAAFAGSRLPGAGSIRAEWAASGSWKAEPGAAPAR